MKNNPYTMILDLDGTLCESPNRNLVEQLSKPLKLLPGVLEKLREWDRIGCTLIILTGRPSGCRNRTEEQLKEANIFYETLIMGVGGKGRVLINDQKRDGTRTAFAISPPENKGIGDIELELVGTSEFQSMKDKCELPIGEVL